jgi:hypothetical protein
MREIHRADRLYLCGFNADLTSPDFLAEYDLLRKCWERASNKGGMGLDTLLLLSAKYQKQAEPVVEEVAVVEARAEETIAEVITKPSRNGKPKKELQVA